MDNWQGGFASAMQAGSSPRKSGRREEARSREGKEEEREGERAGIDKDLPILATVRRPSSWPGLIYEWDQASEEVVGGDWSRLVPLWYHIDQSFLGLAPLSGSPSYQDTARPPPLPSPFSLLLLPPPPFPSLPFPSLPILASLPFPRFYLSAPMLVPPSHLTIITDQTIRGGSVAKECVFARGG